MWIQTSDEQLQAFYVEDLMGEYYDPPGVKFSDNGTAQVVEEVGERLVAEFESISPYTGSDTE